MLTRSAALFGIIVCLPFFTSTSVWGQNGGFYRQAVGGVSISTDGVLRQPDAADLRALRDYNERTVKHAPNDLAAATELRMISLRAICEALQAAQGKDLEALPPDLQYLGGIQRLQYIFVYPERHDIVLAGPGEGWKLDNQGNVVGQTTGRPVLQLSDLLVAFQTTQAARQGGVSCSIDPTAEGRQHLDAYLAHQRVMHAGVKTGVEKALGQQAITLTGVPTTSHFARTMVASDYQMKRIAMHLEQPPLASLPSFLELLVKSNTRITNMMPRWWLACDYEPLARGEDGLSWEIRGQGVKVMTEDEIIAADGSVTQTGKADPVAQKWADNMTKQYAQLSEKLPVFTDLRNIMDMAVIAAVIAKDDLAGQAGVDLTQLRDKDGSTKVPEYPTPKWIDSQCSLMKRGREWVITASGGVDINSWEVASHTVPDQKVAQRRLHCTPPATVGLAWDPK